MEPTFPVFILSCERSGSTLLHYILDTHPDICCPGDLSLGALIKDLRVTVSRTFGTTAADDPVKRDALERKEVRRILTGLLSRYARIQGKKIWCDKTPYNLKYLTHIEWAFPEARYVCLHRDSLDVVQSCMELPEKDFIWWALPYVIKHRRNYPAAFLESWVEKTLEILAFETRNPLTYRIKYESMVGDPVKALDPLFRFLELE